jgi:hypothetical protein
LTPDLGGAATTQTLGAEIHKQLETNTATTLLTQ